MSDQQCFVRLPGGGLEKLDQYVLARQPEQFKKLQNLMRVEGRKFHQVLTSLLIRHMRDRPRVIATMKNLQWWVVKQTALYRGGPALRPLLLID